MKVTLAQVNPTVADLAGNVARCIEAVETAVAQGAELVVLPEMVVPGYPPRDILFDNSFTEAVFEATHDLATQLRGAPPTLAGTVTASGQHLPHHPGLYNAAVLLHGGTAQFVAAKRLLPTYDVFYEARWFMPGSPSSPVTVAGHRVGVLICEDLWDKGYNQHPPADLLEAGAELLISISASPYRRGTLTQRLYHMRRPQCPLVYVNLVGANDELIFDGRSFALNADGEVLTLLPGFEEAVQTVEVGGGRIANCELRITDYGLRITDYDPEEEVFQALMLGVRDFARKNGIRRAVLGLSGGVDSAVVAVIAAEALGAANVTAVAIPSRYSDPRSTGSARELAEALGIHFEVVELESLHAATEDLLGDLLTHGTAAENVQARLRAIILMAFVNHYGGMLLNTSNKTELTVGYSTLYGDMAGSLCPIADLTKPEVYALAAWIQTTRGAPIPAFMIERPPSAELKPDQVDPFDYPKISPLLEQLVQENRSNTAIRRAEHKRWHMGVILKVSEKAFGTGRMIPITRR
ncbi:MAG: NAD+ synthase [Anaerolineae bacterium]|nr:NAD+ synthase [Anaerolineae bacterium]